MISYINARKESVIIIEWPCGAGKSTVLKVNAHFLCKANPEQKVIIALPNELLKLKFQNDMQNTNVLALPESLMKVGTGGCFICTHEQLMGLPDAVLRESIVQIDELHELLGEQFLFGKLEKCKRVIALSATLGGTAGKERIRE